MQLPKGKWYTKRPRTLSTSVESHTQTKNATESRVGYWWSQTRSSKYEPTAVPTSLVWLRCAWWIGERPLFSPTSTGNSLSIATLETTLLFVAKKSHNSRELLLAWLTIHWSMKSYAHSMAKVNWLCGCIASKNCANWVPRTWDGCVKYVATQY